jgi:hypothetical protein
MFCTPAFAGVTTQETFYEFINFDDLAKKISGLLGDQALPIGNR